MKRFPEGFVWGSATSSYQIEGAAHEDGRGESIWDRFAKTPGTIADNSNGNVACDHYHQFATNIDLMASLGMKAYRFSIAWPRILPTGRRAHVETRGLDFYDRLVDRLLEAKIIPFVTLYHWDLPQALEDAGGWPSRDTALAFVDFADVVSRRLGDRVKHWITHNEPWCISVLGHANGHHAPGRSSFPLALATAHHLNLSHGLAVPVLRQNAPGAEVGITLNLLHCDPASPSEADHLACRELDGTFNRWYLDPIFGRGYPEDIVRLHRQDGHLPPEGELPFVKPGDMDIAAREIDFLGVNYYSRAIVRSAKVPESDNLAPTVFAAEDATDMGWEIHPEGLLKILRRVHSEYSAPRIYVTENGAAFDTGPGADGRIRDTRRRDFLRGHLEACQTACDEGIPLRGYFLWSLLDNYEWAHGYAKRFGVVWVDYETQQRIPKESARWYREVIRANALPERDA
ncbi:MAG: beta-glucosidase [Polyangiaceae bacterium]|nr:beta-glucosidase [Polyangiaceae bacterium]